MKKSESSRANNSSWIEYKFAFFLVAFTGLVGSIYILSTISQGSNNSAHDSISYTFNAAERDQSILKIDGILSQNQRLNFHISNFNSKIPYSIDFGNGTCQTITKPRFHYTYEQAGNYNVELSIEFQKNVFLIEKKLVEIEAYSEVTAEL